MGNCHKKESYKLPNNLHKISVCSFNIKLTKSINCNDKIDQLVDFIITSDVDIICLQGLYDKNLCKILHRKIYEYKLDNDKIYTCPLIFMPGKKTAKLEQVIYDLNDKSSTEENIIYHDFLILSKYEIHTQSIMELSIGYCKTPLYFITVNINEYLITIYNFSLLQNQIGVSNLKIRKKQLCKFRELIEIHKKNMSHKDIFKNYVNNNTHIICCDSYIVDTNNECDEYSEMIKLLKVVDTYKYVQYLKGKIVCENDNEKMQCNRLETNYIFLEQNDSTKMTICNSIIKTNFDLFDEFPIVTDFVFEKNTIRNEPFEDIEIVEILL